MKKKPVRFIDFDGIEKDDPMDDPSDRTAGKNMREFLKSKNVDVEKIEFKHMEKPSK